MTALDPRLPVLVGAGQCTHRATTVDDGLEPVALMERALVAAAEDAGLSAVPNPDSIRVVSLLSWRYRDPARVLADRLGLQPKETGYSSAGGNTPQMLVNMAAGEIQRGEIDLVVLAGAEAWRTRGRARKQGVELPWTKVAPDLQPTRHLGAEIVMSHPSEQERGLFLPVQFYPMFETAVRAANGEGVEEHLVKASELWARFSEVASRNPYAWIQQRKSAEEIRTPGPTNRMIGLPYTKQMNSNNDVDQGAALILCSVEKAEALGIPRDRWVFIHAGTDCHDHLYVSNRDSLAASPAVRVGGRRALELAGTSMDEIAYVDLYSCFPSAVQIGADALGLSLDRQLTQTGGLAFAGGPWNNYVMHAIATVAARLREDPGTKGFVWGNGGYVTKHAFGVYSTTPPSGPFLHEDPQDEIDALPARELALPEDAAGATTVEAYTVMHDRDGNPETAIATALVSGGRRAYGLSTDRTVAAAMCDGEWVGRPITLDAEGTLHI